MARYYKNILRILEKWPLDKTKGDRDLGILLRERIKLAFPTGETSVVDETACDRTQNILRRLTEDYHLKANPRSSQSSSTGLSAEQCKGILSEEFIEAAQHENKTILSRVIGSFRK